MLNTYHLLFIPLLLCTFNLSANVMIPAFMVVWPLAWLLFIPIVFIEAFVMQRFLKQESFMKLLYLNTVSNGLSTFVGIPIAFLVYGLLWAIPISAALNVRSMPRLWFLILALGILSLFPLFFFISVWIEKWTLRKFLHEKYEKIILTQATRSANIASYVFLFFAYIIVWVGSIYYPTIFRIFSFW